MFCGSSFLGVLYAYKAWAQEGFLLWEVDLLPGETTRPTQSKQIETGKEASTLLPSKRTKSQPVVLAFFTYDIGP